MASLDKQLDALLFQIPTNYMSHTGSNKEAQLGLYYLAEYADKHGMDVRIKYMDPAEPCLSEMYSLIELSQCRIVGFYVDNENIWTLRRFIPELKKKFPNIHFIVGGPQVTGAPELVLERIPDITCGIVGYGEIPFLKLLQANCLSIQTMSCIDALVYYDEDNNIIKNKVAQHNNIDEFDFPRRKKYSLDADTVSFSQIVTGRGCIGRCAFCFEGSKTHNQPRQRSLSSCFEELDYLTSTFPKQKYYAIADDTFILNKERTLLFCKTIKEKYGKSFKWFCEGRVDILDRISDVLPIMKDAGLVRIQLGGESGCQEVLDTYNKGITTNQILSVTKSIISAGIPSIYINFIIGGANETEETFLQTLNFAKKLLKLKPGIVEVGASYYSPTPGSPMYNAPEKYGIRIIDRDLITGADCNSVFVETETLSKYRIRQLKTFFDNEIDNCYTNLLNDIPNDVIIENFRMAKKYQINTKWRDTLSKIENYNNFYSAIVSGAYEQFINIKRDELEISVPMRTTPPISDGTQNLRMQRNGSHVPNSRLEDAVISLSSGKLNFSDIYNILLEQQLIDKETGFKKLCDLYEKFDKELVIVWRNKF